MWSNIFEQARLRPGSQDALNLMVGGTSRQHENAGSRISRQHATDNLQTVKMRHT
ncbi:hypothetical protein L838_4387 [Mycobacterium avium MAV_120709_2344]|nr:hypothetical protein L838_4387 [Mycobacterium avium MAV_120709_2344]